MSPVMKAICLAMALLALPSAQADTRERREQRLAQVLAYSGAPVDSVRYRGTDSWEALGDHSLLLWETRQRAYFVDVQSNCDDSPWANAILVDFRNLTLDSKFDSILVGGSRCRIEEIRPVDVPGLKTAQRQARRDDDDD